MIMNAPKGFIISGHQNKEVKGYLNVTIFWDIAPYSPGVNEGKYHFQLQD
jgi:hypothetical protein